MSILKRFKNNRILKRFAALAAAGILAVSLSACGMAGTGANSSINSKQTDTVAEATVTETVESAEYSAPSESSSNYTQISLSDSGSSCSSSYVDIDGDTVTITKKGVYELSGSLSDGQIIVDADGAEVELILNNVSISNDSSAAIYVKQAETVYITLEENTVNKLSTIGEYEAIDENDIDAVIFSKDDLIITGSGSLTVDNDYGHGIVGKDDLTIVSGTYEITCAEDALSGNDSITVESGTYTINSGDDAIHSDLETVINGGTINIESCEEGIEGATVTINGGDINITASDDGINAASDDATAETYIAINGGNLIVESSGDGIDANGALYVTGGNTIVYGPTNDGNGALDYDSTAKITGGTFIAIGSSGMAMNFSEAEQGTILVNTGSAYGEGTVIKLTDSEGNVITELESKKTFSSVLISSPEIASDGSYTLTVGDTQTEISMEGNIYGSGMGGFPGGGGFGGQGGFGGGKGGFGGGRDGSGGQNGNPGQHPGNGEMPEGGFDGQTPPEMPEGGFDGQTPPEMPDRQMPEGGSGGNQ